MSRGYWGSAQERETGVFDEKAYRRKNLAMWDARRHGLSKLRGQGIMVQGAAEARGGKAKAKKKGRPR